MDYGKRTVIKHISGSNYFHQAANISILVTRNIRMWPALFTSTQWCTWYKRCARAGLARQVAPLVRRGLGTGTTTTAPVHVLLVQRGTSGACVLCQGTRRAGMQNGLEILAEMRSLVATWGNPDQTVYMPMLWVLTSVKLDNHV